MRVAGVSVFPDALLMEVAWKREKLASMEITSISYHECRPNVHGSYFLLWYFRGSKVEMTYGSVEGQTRKRHASRLVPWRC